MVQGQTCLIFFGDLTNSWYGTLRSLVAFVLLATVFGLVVMADDDINPTVDDMVVAFVALVWFVSALTVQVPRDNMDAVKYGASVGLYTIGLIVMAQYVINKDAVTKRPRKYALYSLTGVAVFAAVSLAVYAVASAHDWYPYSCRE